jgi:hypothetical protein
VGASADAEVAREHLFRPALLPRNLEQPETPFGPAPIFFAENTSWARRTTDDNDRPVA